MSTYIVTGGMNGIGKSTADILRGQGHSVYVVDYEGGEIIADLGSHEGRAHAIQRVYELCPDGIDGLAAIAGISAPNSGKLLAVNYYGSVQLADGLFPLLEKKHGACVMTVSASLSWSRPEDTPNLAEILTSCDDEQRVCAFADSLAASGAGVNTMYYSSKLALGLWVRRHSIEWGTRGVRLLAVAPGCVKTRLGELSAEEKARLQKAGVQLNESFHMTIPLRYAYGDMSLMPPQELGEAFAFLLSDKAAGFSGGMIFVDAGQEAFYNTDKVYF